MFILEGLTHLPEPYDTSLGLGVLVSKTQVLPPIDGKANIQEVSFDWKRYELYSGSQLPGEIQRPTLRFLPGPRIF